jgi:hypothetical protein
MDTNGFARSPSSDSDSSRSSSSSSCLLYDDLSPSPTRQGWSPSDKPSSNLGSPVDPQVGFVPVSTSIRVYRGGAAAASSASASGGVAKGKVDEKVGAGSATDEVIRLAYEEYSRQQSVGCREGCEAATGGGSVRGGGGGGMGGDASNRPHSVAGRRATRGAAAAAAAAKDSDSKPGRSGWRRIVSAVPRTGDDSLIIERLRSVLASTVYLNSYFGLHGRVRGFLMAY